MKILKYIVIVLLPVLSSCLNEDFSPATWALDPDLSFSNSVVVFNSTLSTDTVAVFTNYSEFKAESSQDWCKVSVDPYRNLIVINSEPNFDVQQRSAVITVSIERGSKSLSKDVSVVQMGGVWETIGNFNLYWGYEIGNTQKDAIVDLLKSMVYIPAGSFIMGKTDEEIVDGAKPHEVSLSPYYIASFELTQSQWNAIMGENPSLHKDPNLPVYNISWAEALEYVTRLSKLTNLDVRLPSEAQWEYAARGGKSSHGYTYSGSNVISDVAKLEEGMTTPYKGGLYLPNELGLYDMSGNVSEYCYDWYEMYYVGDIVNDPVGPESGKLKCVRGGNVSDASSKYHLRSTNRDFEAGINRIKPLTGMRIVIIP